MMRPTNRNLTFLALALAVTPALVAQESTGSVVGFVKTKGGEAVAGAEVRLTSPSLQGTRTVITDAKGAFRAPLLPPGTYRVVVMKEGFSAPRVELEIGLGQVVRSEITVSSSAAQAVVEVVANSGAVDKTDVKTSTNVSSELMDLLPRVTRGMNDAALLSPGVAVGVGSRVQIRGGVTTQNRYLLNGTDIADNVFGDTTGRGYYVDDSIQEMQVIQSPVHARYGNFTGGVINAITKSGGNDFTGVVRGVFSRASWSAQSPLGMRPNTKPSNAGTLAGEDVLNRNYTLNLGGPIIKDMLWFSLSTKLDPATITPQTFNNVTSLTTGDGSGSASFGGNGPVTWNGNTYVPGGAFLRSDKNTFYELKLTYAINPSHTLELAGNKNKTEQVNRFYVASFDPDTLVPQTNENDYLTLAYRGIIGNNITLEARYAKKHQVLSAGGDPTKGDPIRARYSNGSFYIFQNGIFDKTDGGDNRDIKTYIANIQWFSPETALGMHTVDLGFEILQQDRQAANAQSPTGRQILVWGRNLDGTYRVSGPVSSTAATNNYILLYDVDKGTAKGDFQSFYVNDLWAVNSKFQAMFGVRYDKVTSKDTLGSTTVSSSQMSPRLQMTYDLRGDQAWLFRGSFARYVGKLNDSYTNRFTRAGNPISEAFYWGAGASTNATGAQLGTLSNWNVTGAGLRSYSGPLNRFGDPNTKAPYTDEYSFNLKHGMKDGSFVSFTYTKRIGRNFFNDFFSIGDEAVVPLRYVPGVSVATISERWANDSSMVRDYKSLEFEFLSRLNTRWSLGGNYTYAILKGNGEGSEGSNPPVSGDVIGDFSGVHDKFSRGTEYYAPYGYLTGDQAHRANIYLSYMDRSKAGASLYGSLMLNYRGGGTYSLTRGTRFEVPEEALANPNALASYGAWGSYTRYFGPRGIGRFNDTFNFDLKLGWEIPLWKTARFFTEFTVFNVFNHWQLASYSTSGNSGTSLYATSPLAGYSAVALTKASNGDLSGFGTYGSGDYVGGRSVQISTGFKW